MRVVVIASWYPDQNRPLNGVFFKEQAEALKRSGVDVVVINVNMIPIRNLGKVKTPFGLSISKENGINIYRYTTYNIFPKMYSLYIKYYASILSKIIKKVENEEGKIDVIHIQSAFDAGIAYSKIKDKIPYVITEHSSRYHRGIVNKSEDKMLYNLFKEANRVIAVGKGLSDKISKYAKDREIDIIPNMVSLQTKDIKVDSNKSKFRFFSLAFLNSYKGMDILIEAFNRNKDLLSQIELYIGGDGPEKENLQWLVKKYNLEKNIFLLGELNREEVAFQMQNCDAFILASRVETFGIVFIEAMLNGKPVIGTRTGGPDTFINDKCGITVPIDDIEALASAMGEMYSNYNMYSSDYIKNYCENTFSEKIITERLKLIYNEVMGETDV